MTVDFHAPSRRPGFLSGAGLLLPGAAAALAASAIYVREQTRRAELAYPPRGKFLSVNGVRLHFIDTGGDGPAVVLLHGNGAMIADMEISGLVNEASKHYRVVAFDRPGYGHSERPRDRVWGPRAQADLFAQALAQLGLRRPLVFAHSWGTQVAAALALDHPDSVGGLVLASGYYFPGARADGIMAAPATMPVLGEVLRHTISPVIARVMTPAVFRKMFAPQPVPPRFSAEFPVALTLRPSQMRASSQETALMVPAAAELEGHYHRLRLPVFIMAGADDRVVDPDRQSVRLHGVIRQSALRIMPGLGHMVHHFATEQVIRALDAVSARVQPHAAAVA